MLFKSGKMTIADLLLWGKKQLYKTSESPELEAGILLGHCVNKPKEYLAMQSQEELNIIIINKYKELINKRKMHYPISYLTGKQEFYGHVFRVSKDVLIPSPDSEILVQTALNFCSKITANKISVWDIATGSGCLGLSIMLESKFPVQLLATDISAQALKVAKENAVSLIPAGRMHAVQFAREDIFRTTRKNQARLHRRLRQYAVHTPQLQAAACRFQQREYKAGC